MSCRVLVVALALAIAPAIAWAEPEATDRAAVEERRARDGIRELRDVARTLRRMSKRAASDEAATAAWLRSAGQRVGKTASRWSSALEYFHRDFPREALLADPERLAYAGEWLAERNDRLAESARSLARDLEAEASELRGSGAVEEALALLERLQTGSGPTG